MLASELTVANFLADGTSHSDLKNKNKKKTLYEMILKLLSCTLSCCRRKIIFDFCVSDDLSCCTPTFPLLP